MSIFDGDRNPLNVPFPTLGGKTFWDVLNRNRGYTLQQNKATKHCRILNSKNIRVAWGDEGPMRAKFEELTHSNRTMHAQYGDVIGVHRIGGVYDHYGVYESDDRVYEYAAHDGDFGHADIHITTLKKFIGDSDNYFVLTFPEMHGTPGKIKMPTVAHAGAASAFGNGVPGMGLDALLELIESIKKTSHYHLFTPEETIRRAKSRLGETNYNLITNNCEHYAIWCKTGIKESHQVDALLQAMRIIQGNLH